MPIELTPEQFEEIVGHAIDDVPDELIALIDNCVILIEDDSPPGEEVMLGLYDGVPLTERGNDYGGVGPDRIFIFRRPTLSICSTIEEVMEEVQITVVHEIAHHFGIDDHRLHELGYD